MNKDSMGDRMKRYESVSRSYLIPRMPVIIRVDGKAFHTALHWADKPYDSRVSSMMRDTAEFLLYYIQGAKCFYTQSDEISVLVTDYDTLKTEAWFGNNVQKLASVSASMATAAFNISRTSATSNQLISGPSAGYLFDARAFNLPEDDVANYFYWRAKDNKRNVVSSCARHEFGHAAIQGKSYSQLEKELEEIGKGPSSLPSFIANGAFGNGDITEGVPVSEIRDKVNEVLRSVRRDTEA